MDLGTARSVDQRFTHCAMGLLSLQSLAKVQRGNDYEDAGELRVLNEKNGSDHVHPRRPVRASTCISRKIYGCKMKALASPPLILFIVVAVARYIVTLVSFFRVSTQNCFCLAWRQVVHRIFGGVEKHAGLYVKY